MANLVMKIIMLVGFGYMGVIGAVMSHTDDPTIPLAFMTGGIIGGLASLYAVLLDLE